MALLRADRSEHAERNHRDRHRYQSFHHLSLDPNRASLSCATRCPKIKNCGPIKLLRRNPREFLIGESVTELDDALLHALDGPRRQPFERGTKQLEMIGLPHGVV